MEIGDDGRRKCTTKENFSSIRVCRRARKEEKEKLGKYERKGRRREGWKMVFSRVRILSSVHTREWCNSVTHVHR